MGSPFNTSFGSVDELLARGSNDEESIAWQLEQALGSPAGNIKPSLHCRDGRTTPPEIREEEELIKAQLKAEIAALVAMSPKEDFGDFQSSR